MKQKFQPCEVCRIREGRERHRIIEGCLGGTYSPENVALLCEICHLLVPWVNDPEMIKEAFAVYKAKGGMIIDMMRQGFLIGIATARQYPEFLKEESDSKLHQFFEEKVWSVQAEFLLRAKNAELEDEFFNRTNKNLRRAFPSHKFDWSKVNEKEEEAIRTAYDNSSARMVTHISFAKMFGLKDSRSFREWIISLLKRCLVPKDKALPVYFPAHLNK